MAQCDADPWSDACVQWLSNTTGNPDYLENRYREKYCANGNRVFDDERCRRWCVSQPDACRSRLVYLCRIPSNNHDVLCACFQSTDFYQERAMRIQEELRKAAAGTNFTPPPISPQPHCVYPACAASGVAHSGNPIQCPNTIQQYCVQNIDVNNGGTILSLGGVTQQAKCILDAATGTNQHINNTNKSQTAPRRSPPDFMLPAAAIALVVVLLLLWGDED